MRKYENESDGSLVEKTLLGESAAYEELVLRHERAVMGTAMKTTHNRFSAEDASQDAFVAAWLKLDGLRDPSRFSSFVCAAAKHCAADIMRRCYCAAPDVSLELMEYADLDEQTKFAAQDEEEYARLREEVAALGEETQTVIRAHYFEGLTVREIAERLGEPEGTVKWRLSEGRKLLRKGYGIMEKEYDENETLVRRVMRQVEELKLWRLKNSKEGFEAEYRAVLAAVEALEDSEAKQHALADVLRCGLWWIPGEQNDETRKRMREAAEAGHNEDAMTSVIWDDDVRDSHGQKRIDLLRGKLLWLEEHGFVKTQAYVWFWMGDAYMDIDRDEARACFGRARSLLTPVDVYYANAVAALRILPEYRGGNDEEYCATGELLKKINGKYYFWAQPGFGGSEYDSALYYYAGQCDCLLFDGDLRVGETRTASDGRTTLTFAAEVVTVETPAGCFANCRRYRIDGGTSSWIRGVETDYAEGVGIVRQKIWEDTGEKEWRLSSYLIRGGEGHLPFAAGNRWEYKVCRRTEGYLEQTGPSVYEVIGMNADTVNIAHSYYNRQAFDLDSFMGNMLYACREYGSWDPRKLTDTLPYIEKAKALAKTRREAMHAEIARRVLYRVLHTDPSFDPDFTEYGRWNHFWINDLERTDGGVKLSHDEFDLAIRWYDMGSGCGGDGWAILHNGLYDVLSDAAEGYVWRNEWKPGVHYERKFDHWGTTYRVTFDAAPQLERVETPAGVFEDCLHLTFDLEGPTGPNGYRGGVKDYWFAPNIGIVQMKTPVGGIVSHWALTEYRGRGAGYFPAEDGFFRRYEAQNLTGGYHGSVEYTYLEDERGLTVFRDALGTQDRADYEAVKDE